jgi:hypothetical protein
LGLGDEIPKGLKLLIGTYQTYPNGLTNDANGRFEYLGSHLAAISESLLQSYDDRIRAFPAVPSQPDFVGRFSLLARGGFLVSSEYEKGGVKYMAIKSLYGNTATIMNPWGSERLRVKRGIGNETVLVTVRQEFTFDTTAGTLYIIERAATPLREYPHERLTGIANGDAKRLTGSPAMLGSPNE